MAHTPLLRAFVLSAGFCATALAQAAPFSADDVIAFENQWGDGIVSIGKSWQAGGDYKGEAQRLIAQMYAYDDGKVLFKPTKAAQDQFRETADQALSYFVGGGNPEDHGFAIQPWSKVRFENHEIITHDDMALAMGNYYFTDAKTGKEVKVEFSFGLMHDPKDGHPELFLHHSSLPYQPQH